ncbi:MAG: hypothetical protein J1G38_06390 [Clostridiales bacterium]|nr:hypothetical protein [Clostridiales bacterium]
MAQYSSGAYFISKKRRGPSGGRRGVGFLIVVLLLLTAGICILAVFFPFGSEQASSEAETTAATFYFLATQECTDRQAASDGALSASSRGGAGYIYNDGSYKIIAAAYRKEGDAKALAEVNDGAFYFKFELKFGSIESKDRAAVKYLTGEWFDALFNAADSLERGNITDAEADRTVRAACLKLLRYADKSNGKSLVRALQKAGEYSPPTGRSLQSYIRYVAVRALDLVALSSAVV